MRPHYQDDGLVIYKIKCGPYDNNAYVVVCPRTNRSVVIDAPAEPGPMLAVARETEVQAVVITHNHFDHIMGLEEVRQALGAPVGIGAADAGALATPPDFLLEDGGQVRAGDVVLTALATPGHTPGSTCLVTGRHLFTGDTLFPGGPGKTRSPENLRQILDSITTRLFALGDDVVFYPGHGDDGDLKTAKEEYAVFASREHPADLCGDVLWLES